MNLYIYIFFFILIFKCQRGWIYLEPIFASDDITQKMPNEKKKFDRVD